MTRRPIADILAELEERDLKVEFTAIAKSHGVLLREMFEPYINRPKARISEARHECWTMLVNRDGWSTTRCGALFGVDHSSVLAGLKSHERRMAKAFMREVRSVA